MDKEETIKQLQNAIDQLKCENELLKELIRELEARLAKGLPINNLSNFSPYL